MNTATAMLSSGEMYDVIVDVVGDETSLEFCTLTSYYIDGNDLDTAMRANGTQWETINELTSEIDEKANKKLKQKQETIENTSGEEESETKEIGDGARRDKQYYECPACGRTALVLYDAPQPETTLTCSDEHEQTTMQPTTETNTE